MHVIVDRNVRRSPGRRRIPAPETFSLDEGD
jgi:hypothetical protein